MMIMRNIGLLCATAVMSWMLTAAAAAQTTVKPPQSRPAPPVRPTAPPATPATSPTSPPATAPEVEAPKESPPPPVDPGWLERLKEDDRQPLEDLRHFAPPPLGSDLVWLPERQGVPSKPLSWNELRGRVVVVQSFTTGNLLGRKWLERTGLALKGFQPKDVRVIGLHTPENAANAEAYFSKQQPPPGVVVAVDAKGTTCDALGMYKTPVNIVVDRQGVVRFVGLNDRGVVQAVAQLTQEKFDAARPPPARTATAAPKPDKNADFPPFAGRVQSAEDMRGKTAPSFVVDEWITRQPDMRNRVTVVEFWATWCKTCEAAIPHMNDLAAKFGDRAAFIAISDERQIKFEEGLRKIDRKTESFNYALALDSKNTMAQAIKVTGIPHCLVMSSDWVVRWQGMPMQLNDKLLEQIINADANASGTSAASNRTGKARKRWADG